VVMAVYTLVNV